MADLKKIDGCRHNIFQYLIQTLSDFKMELSNNIIRSLTLKVVVPKGKQAEATKALQGASLGSLENWASLVECLLVERKAYVELVETSYKQFSSKNGAFIFQMIFLGKEGQLFNVFHTPGLVDALKLIDPYAAAEHMELRTASGVYHIGYGGGDPLDMNLPPLALVTPRPGPPAPSAPARSAPSPTPASIPFTEPTPRMPTLVSPMELAPVSVAPISSAPISSAPISPAPNALRFLVNCQDSILSFNLNIAYNTSLKNGRNATLASSETGSNAEEFEDWVASEWVHFYDAVSLPNEKKTYDVKFLAGTGVKLTATFHAHVDNYADIFTEEALHHLEEVAYVCNDDIIYVQAPYINGTSSAVYYEPILTHYVRVGKTNGFACCFGGEGEAAPVQEIQPIAPSQPMAPKKQPSKAEQRYNALGSMAHHMEEEIRQLKEEQAEIQAQIAEKETRIRMFQFAQDELYDTMMF
jgi:hypothetical protein